MGQEQHGNPYHINEKMQHDHIQREEKNLNHIYDVLDELLREIKLIRKKVDALEEIAQEKK